MENESILILSWAIIVTIALLILVALVVRLRKKHDSDMDEMEERLKHIVCSQKIDFPFPSMK